MRPPVPNDYLIIIDSSRSPNFELEHIPIGPFYLFLFFFNTGTSEENIKKKLYKLWI